MRFVTKSVHADSHQSEGVFAAAYSLLESDTLDSDERMMIREILVWFNQNLPHPPRKFSAQRAVFWFKSRSAKCVKQIWELVHVLELHGYNVEVFKCRHLANISYEDEHQVAAYPSKRDGKIKTQ